MPTPANPIPSPRALLLVATSWYRASSLRCIPRPSSTIVSVASAASVRRRIRVAPESSAFATTSVRIVSSRAPVYASHKSSRRCWRSTRVSPTWESYRPEALSLNVRTGEMLWPGARERVGLSPASRRRRGVAGGVESGGEAAPHGWTARACGERAREILAAGRELAVGREDTAGDGQRPRVRRIQPQRLVGGRLRLGEIACGERRFGELDERLGVARRLRLFEVRQRIGRSPFAQ